METKRTMKCSKLLYYTFNRFNATIIAPWFRREKKEKQLCIYIINSSLTSRILNSFGDPVLVGLAS